VPITEADLILNPCPVCGRRPQLISYNVGPHSNPDFRDYYRLVCAHDSLHSKIPSCKTRVFDMIYKCQDEWNKGDDINCYFTQKRPTRIDQVVSHEKFIEFLGGDGDGSGC